MKEIQVRGEKIIKAFDHSMYKVIFKAKSSGDETFEINILARNVVTLINMINKYPPHGQNSQYILSVKHIGVCSDVYIGDLHKHLNK